jgi:hypothetical protein
MTSGENGVFWEQMEELEHTKGEWNCPNFLKHFPKPQHCKSRCYLPAEGTLTLMTSGEKGGNGVFWEQREKFGPEIYPDVSIIFPILFRAKTGVISVLGGQ